MLTTVTISNSNLFVTPNRASAPCFPSWILAGGMDAIAYVRAELEASRRKPSTHPTLYPRVAEVP